MAHASMTRRAYTGRCPRVPLYRWRSCRRSPAGRPPTSRAPFPPLRRNASPQPFPSPRGNASPQRFPRPSGRASSSAPPKAPSCSSPCSSSLPPRRSTPCALPARKPPRIRPSSTRPTQPPPSWTPPWRTSPSRSPAASRSPPRSSSWESPAGTASRRPPPGALSTAVPGAGARGGHRRCRRPPGHRYRRPRGRRPVCLLGSSPLVRGLFPSFRRGSSDPRRSPLHGRVRSWRRGHGACPATTPGTSPHSRERTLSGFDVRFAQVVVNGLLGNSERAAHADRGQLA